MNENSSLRRDFDFGFNLIPYNEFSPPIDKLIIEIEEQPQTSIQSPQPPIQSNI